MELDLSRIQHSDYYYIFHKFELIILPILPTYLFPPNISIINVNILILLFYYHSTMLQSMFNIYTSKFIKVTLTKFIF